MDNNKVCIICNKEIYADNNIDVCDKCKKEIEENSTITIIVG